MIISRWHSKCTKNLIILLLLLVLQRRCEWVNEYLTVWFDVMWCYDATTNQWKPSPCNLFHQKYICNLLLLDKHKQKIEWSWTQSPEAASIDFALLGYYVSIDFVSMKKDAWRRRAIMTSLEKSNASPSRELVWSIQPICCHSHFQCEYTHPTSWFLLRTWIRIL